MLAGHEPKDELHGKMIGTSSLLTDLDLAGPSGNKGGGILDIVERLDQCIEVGAAERDGVLGPVDRADGVHLYTSSRFAMRSTIISPAALSRR